MGVGALQSVTINSGTSSQAVLVFGIPSGSSWTASFTVSSDPTTFPVLTVGSGGNINTLHVESVAVAPALNGSNLQVTVQLTGYAYSGETVTATTIAGWITDSLGNTSGAATGATVTNSSAAAKGSALTRFTAKPIATWAIQDQFPFGFNADTLTATTTARIALEAIDNHAGIIYVELVFSAAVTVVSDPNVINEGSNTYRITAKRWADVFGYGNSGEYWYLDLDISGVASTLGGMVALATVSEVHIATNDGVVTSMVAAGKMNTRAIRVLKNPIIKYLDPNATGAANGTDWADAWTTFDTMATGVAATDDIVLIKPGTYTTALTSFSGKFGSRTEFLRLVGTDSSVLTELTDTSGSGLWGRPNNPWILQYSNSATQLTLISYLSFENYSFATTGDGMCYRGDALGYIRHRNYYFNFSECCYSNASGANGPFPQAGTRSHDIAWIFGRQTKGFNGITCSGATATICHDHLAHTYLHTNGGTTFRPQFTNGLVEYICGHDQAQDASFAANTHFDFMHSGLDSLSYAQRVVVRYCLAYNCGSSSFGYNFWLQSTGELECVAYQNRAYVHESTNGQHPVQIEGNAQYVYWLYNTILTVEAAESWLWTAHTANNPQISIGIWVYNNIGNGYQGSPDSPPNAQGEPYPISRCKLAGPNFWQLRASDIATYEHVDQDGSVSTSDGTQAKLRIVSVASAPPNLSVYTDSRAVPANGLVSSMASDVRFTPTGTAMPQNGTAIVGYSQTAAAGGGGDAPGTHNYGPTQAQYIAGNTEPGNSTASYGPTMYDYIHGNINNLQSFYPSPVWGVTMNAYIAGQR